MGVRVPPFAPSSLGSFNSLRQASVAQDFACRLPLRSRCITAQLRIWRVKPWGASRPFRTIHLEILRLPSAKPQLAQDFACRLPLRSRVHYGSISDRRVNRGGSSPPFEPKSSLFTILQLALSRAQVGCGGFGLRLRRHPCDKSTENCSCYRGSLG